MKIDDRFHVLKNATPPDLWDDIVHREPRAAPEPSRSTRYVAAAVALAVAAAGFAVVVWAFRSTSPEDSVTPAGEALAAIPEGWTELPLPPEVRPGATYQWVGSELIAWGGCDPTVEDDCRETADGFSFDPLSETWRPVPPAPMASAWGHAVWTGERAVFLGHSEEHRFESQAYDPLTRTWTVLPDAPHPLDQAPVAVWTGSEIIVWGGGGPDDPVAMRGAAYDPRANRWDAIADAPLGLSLATGMWTGDEVVVFGSLLDSRNRASKQTSVGAAYDPATDRWSELPPSDLSPQATSAAWIAGRVVAWDYEATTQEYRPGSDAWTERIRMPFEPRECYPDSELVGGMVFAFFCGDAALYDPQMGTWEATRGGPLAETIWSKAYERDLKLWRFADLIPAGDVLFLSMEGLTLIESGEACYGCPGSPRALWAFRPPA